MSTRASGTLIAGTTAPTQRRSATYPAVCNYGAVLHLGFVFPRERRAEDEVDDVGVLEEAEVGRAPEDRVHRARRRGRRRVADDAREVRRRRGEEGLREVRGEAHVGGAAPRLGRRGHGGERRVERHVRVAGRGDERDVGEAREARPVAREARERAGLRRVRGVAEGELLEERRGAREAEREQAGAAAL